MSQIFLALAYGIEAFLMLVHKKHLVLDAMVHGLLGYTMTATATAILLELKKPESFLLSLFRCFSLCMQGVWMIMVGPGFSLILQAGYQGPQQLLDFAYLVPRLCFFGLTRVAGL